MQVSTTYPQHARAILNLGLPLVGGHLAQIAIGVTDTVMLGWYSVEALAAVTLGSTYFFVLFIFGSGFAWAVMPMVASYAAKDDEIGLRRSTRMGLWLSFGFGLLAMPLMIWSEPILRLIGQGDGVARDAGAYLEIAAYGIVPALLVMVIKSYLAALERTQVVLLGDDPCGGDQCHCQLRVDLRQLGRARTRHQGRGGCIHHHSNCVADRGRDLCAGQLAGACPVPAPVGRPDWQMLLQVFLLGWPIGLTALAEVGLFAGSAVMMGWLGTVPLAAHGIALQLASITFMVHLGLSNVATIRAGNAHGRNDPVQMGRGGKMVTFMSLGFAAITIIIFLAAPEMLLSLFMQEDDPQRAGIMAIGVGLLAMAALFQLVDGAQVIALGLLRGVQDTKIPMIYAAVSYWGVGIPCSYLFGFVLGMEGIGVWLGLVVGLSVAAILLSQRFWSVTLRTLKAAQV